LKKLIKKLSATPVLSALQKNGNGGALQDSQASLQANKATFFFRLERELEKVNIFYLQKEAEVGIQKCEFGSHWLTCYSSNSDYGHFWTRSEVCNQEQPQPRSSPPAT
jgi:hypothetical protein